MFTDALTDEVAGQLPASEVQFDRELAFVEEKNWPRSKV